MGMDDAMRDRMRRAVVGVPVDCLTITEIIGLERTTEVNAQGIRKAGDAARNDFARAVAALAAARRAARIRAALYVGVEELAAAFTEAAVAALIEDAIAAAA